MWTVVEFNETIKWSEFHLRDGLLHPDCVWEKKSGASYWANSYSDYPSIDVIAVGFLPVPVPYNRKF